MLTAFAVFGFRVPLTGNFWALALGALLYVFASTALGLLLSSFMKSQIAAIFGTTLITIIPAVQFSGMLSPVRLSGRGRLDRSGLSRKPFRHHLPWCFLQSPRFRRPRTPLVALPWSVPY